MSNALDLVREMREALQWYVDEDDVCEAMPGNEFWVDGLNKARNTIAKADAYLKEGAEMVEYGCHKNDEVTSECAIDTNSPLCLVARVLSQKEHCAYWKPIKESGHE